MREDRKKFSLLTNLNNILVNNCVNNKVFKYDFSSMHTLIINNINYDVSDYIVTIILYLDEFIVELYNKEKLQKSLALPYNTIKEVYILLED